MEMYNNPMHNNVKGSLSKLVFFQQSQKIHKTKEYMGILRLGKDSVPKTRTINCYNKTRIHFHMS